MISSHYWVISGVKIWGGGESIYFEIWGGVAPLAPLVPPPMDHIYMGKLYTGQVQFCCKINMSMRHIADLSWRN